MNQTKTYCATCLYYFNGQCSFPNPCRYGSQIEVSMRIEEQIRKQAVKEFAEKLKTKLFEFFQDNEELDGKISVGPLYVDIIGVEAEDGTIISLGLIDELLKGYGVEVEE